MRLRRLFKFGCATAFVALVILPPCITAAGPLAAAAVGEPSTLAAGELRASAVGEPSTSAAREIEEASPRQLAETRPRAEEYINLLDPERISLYRHDFQVHPHMESLRAVPFDNGYPLFTTKADTSVVEQALDYYGRVGILDLRRREGRLIKYGNRQLEQDFLPDLARALFLYELDPMVHVVRSMVIRGHLALLPRPGVAALPHANGAPILTAASATLDNMAGAASTGTGHFWYLQTGKVPVKIMPREDRVYREARPADLREIERVSAGVRSARLRYGDSLSSVIWGAPVRLQDEYRATRMQRIALSQYPRLAEYDTRDEMIHALQTQGRFRLYKPGESGERYKVKLLNPDAAQDAHMKISVTPLSSLERAQENLLASLDVIHLPH